jgi:hypothetical protein
MLGGIIYGLSYSLMFLEGEDVFLGLPFALLVVLVSLIWGRRRLAVQPVLAFFFTSCLAASVVFLGWLLYWGSFIPPSGAGII